MPEIITDHSDPKIKKYLGLKGINVDSYIIAEGIKSVEKLAKKLKVNEVLTSPKAYEERKLFYEGLGCPILLAEEDFLKKHVGYNFHQGIFAGADHPGFNDEKDIKGPTLVLENLDNAENVGALIRSALGLGFNNILFCQRTSSPYLKRSIRVSMGNVFFANLYKSEDLPLSLKALKDRGFDIVAAANQANAVDYRSLPKSEDLALIIGNEGKGLSEKIKSCATKVAKININENVEHLNAGAAGAILMSHFNTY